jgi:MFS family permease
MISRNLTVLCGASLMWGFSFGIGAPLASLWLHDRGCSATVIGANTGAYYLSVALAGCLAPFLMKRLGRGCLVLGMLASGSAVAAFPWCGSLTGWFLLRALNGVGGALFIIPTETLVNRNAPPAKLSRDFGYYAFSMATGIALGTFIGTQMYPSWPRLAFLLGGVVSLAGLVLILSGLTAPAIRATEDTRAGNLDLVRNFLSFGAAWSQGFLEGGMLALLPVYLLAHGLSDEGVGWLMSGTMMGVISMQVPLAWLADRLGRTRVLMICHGVTIVALAALLPGGGVPLLAICLFMAGACSSAFYPLGLARLGEQVSATALPRASAWFLGINCMGSLTGPVISGIAMDYLGASALISTALLAVLLVLLLWGSLLMLRTPRQMSDSQEVNTSRRAA